jgi:hypothetical protein
VNDVRLDLGAEHGVVEVELSRLRAGCVEDWRLRRHYKSSRTTT